MCGTTFTSEECTVSRTIAEKAKYPGMPNLGVFHEGLGCTYPDANSNEILNICDCGVCCLKGINMTFPRMPYYFWRPCGGVLEDIANEDVCFPMVRGSCWRHHLINPEPRDNLPSSDNQYDPPYDFIGDTSYFSYGGECFTPLSPCTPPVIPQSRCVYNPGSGQSECVLNQSLQNPACDSLGGCSSGPCPDGYCLACTFQGCTCVTAGPGGCNQGLLPPSTLVNARVVINQIEFCIPMDIASAENGLCKDLEIS